MSRKPDLNREHKEALLSVREIVNGIDSIKLFPGA